MCHIKKIFLSILLFSVFNLNAIKTSLLIKMPAHSKPDRFLKILDFYYRKLSHTIPYTFLITCNQADKSINNKAFIKKLKKYPNLVFSFSNNNSIVEAYNRDIDRFEFDVLLVTSDEILPVVKNFDLIIFNTMQETFPDFDGVLNFNDGSIERLCNTIPVIGSKYYKRFGYIYHPAYKSLACEHEFTSVSRILKKEKMLDRLVMRNNMNIQEVANIDKDVLAQRRARFFDLSQEDIERATPKLWSILICTMDEREQQFASLYEKLNQQIYDLNAQDHIEVLYFKDKRGEHTVGFKRNILVEQSKGKYISFIDDDDHIHDKYVELIATKLFNNPDCVNLNGIITFNGKNPKKFVHSIQHKKYSEENNVYLRPPNHLNPIRRSIAAQFTFPVKNFSEDTDWAMQIAQSGLLHTEETIDEPYYFYLFCRKKSR